MNKVDAFDAINDENNTDNVVLYNDKNEPIEFEQIAIVPLGEHEYVILKPVEKYEGVNEDEAIVFRFDETEDNEETLTVETDDKVIDDVFEVYYKLLEEARKG